ncbi:hypothetical protein CPB97_006462 [Podila verticillata]|nr:hypothetical protein CPB97_006462 [Podila verticillata]
MDNNISSAVSRALNIPEILNRVAYVIPVWHCTVDSTIFTPRTLLQCSLVSKYWRAVMLPHLWAACNPSAMRQIPSTVLAENSIHFKYLDQESPYWNARASYLLHAINFALHCTKLKSFSITTFYSEDQVRMLSTNPHMNFLEIREYKSSRDRGNIEGHLQPLEKSLKELRIRDGNLDGRDLLRILRRLPHLESFGCFVKPRSTETSRARDHVASIGQFQINVDKHKSVAISNLKHLTVSSGLLLVDARDILLTIFVHCPGLESIEVQSSSKLAPDSFLQVASTVRRRVMQWRDQIRAWKALTATTEPRGINSLLTGASDGQGINKLVIQVYDDANWGTKRGYQAFDHYCENLIEFEAVLRIRDMSHLKDDLFAYKHTLLRVEIESVGVMAINLVNMIQRIFHTFTELRIFRFVPQEWLTKKESMAILDLQARSPIAQLKDSMVPTERLAKWTCDKLESLDLHGLWQGDKSLGESLSYHRLMVREGRRGKPEFGEGLLDEIFLRVQELPKLRKLKLNDVSFSEAVFHGRVPLNV